MRTLEITLPDPLAAFVEAEVSGGNYDNPSGFVEQLVREAHERREQQIDKLLLEAIESDKPPIEVTPEYWEGKHRRLIERYGSVA